MASQLPSSSESARQIRRALFTFRNLKAIGERHTSLSGIVQELLSQRVGQQKSILEELHDELSDPAATASVVQLSDRLLQAKERGTPVRLPALGGAEIPMRAMLKAAGFAEVLYHADPRSRGDELEIGVNELPEHGFALGVYKALQLAESREFGSAFGDFTAIDIETTDNKVETCEVVEIAAVRVRDGRIVEELARLVKPRGKIAEGARRAHGITDDDVRNEAFMEEVWPAFQEFCGSDVVVAHNGYTFDFRILKRIAKESGLKFDITTFDTLPLARDLFPTSRKLGDLAVKFKIETGTLHRALDDSRLLAHVFLHLEKEKLERARKTGLVNLLGHLGVALALSTDDSASAEQKLFRDRICTVFSLGRYSGAIEHYEAESRERADVPGVDEVIERLGGAAKMERLRADKSASDRYPTAMARLRRIIEEISEGDLRSQIREFLDRAMLSSKSDGYEPDPDRVNLLTLHSTKGLEFSRVYIVGVEDAQMPGGTEVHPASMHEIEEARRLLYVGMTRASQRLVLTRAETRAGRPTGGHRFLDEMGVPPGKAP
jgi:DNA helicase II / ATP-dependent DNA helicase PcrA